MEFVVAPLPYAKDALAPAISERTVEFHYEKHHKGYMTKLKGLLEGKPEASQSLEQVVKSSSGPIFNNAAQIYNHTFFWDGMKPSGGGAPPAGAVADLINGSFGGWEQFRTELIAAGMGRFGSGWAWLVLDAGKGKIVSTPNAETPLTTAAKPLLTVDVWEHAYYLDYQNRRDGFLEIFCDKLINWDFVAKNLKG
ncbi:MAG TPA: superoxide dismutase [Polyangiaceae bacterium]|jgi:Fe-Mn family superoxide dismutase|nr:superoxide dismutase [Polyangiaceae bacterium]